MKQLGFFSTAFRPKEADGMANSVYPDQKDQKEQSDQGLHCLLNPINPYSANHDCSRRQSCIFFIVVQRE